MHIERTPEQESAINCETERIIASNCQRHGITREQLIQRAPGAIEEARNTAVTQIDAEAARKANPLYAELEAAREKNRLQEAQIEALKSSRGNSADNKRPAVTVEVARAKVGELEWNHRMTDAQRLQVLGIDPATVTAETKQTIMEVFGPKSDYRRASDLMKSDPFRYRQLKEIGRALKLI